jgi:hypothetical protein
VGRVQPNRNFNEVYQQEKETF